MAQAVAMHILVNFSSAQNVSTKHFLVWGPPWQNGEYKQIVPLSMALIKQWPCMAQQVYVVAVLTTPIHEHQNGDHQPVLGSCLTAQPNLYPCYMQSDSKPIRAPYLKYAMRILAKNQILSLALKFQRQVTCAW